MGATTRSDQAGPLAAIWHRTKESALEGLAGLPDPVLGPPRWALSLTGATALLAVATLPWWQGGTFNLIRYEQVLLFLMVAIGANLIIGYAGELSFGYPIIVGVGAYTAGVLSVRLRWEPVATVPVAVVSAILVSLTLSIPAFRVKGWYLALITFFSVIIFPDLIDLTKPLTGGEDGLPGIRPLEVGGHQLDDWLVFEVVLLAALVCWTGVRNLVRSGWGLTLLGMRDSPQAIQAVGVDVNRVKVSVAALSAIPMGLAGGLMAHSAQFISTQSFSETFTILIFAGVLLGGASTLLGPVVGTLVLQVFSYYVGPFSQWNPLILGLALLVVRITFPHGLVAALRDVGRAVAAHRYHRHPPSETTTAQRVTPPAVTDLAPREGEGPVLRVRGLRKAFGSQLALRSVDLEVGAGRLVALVGPNGSGKTTFVNVVTGFVRADGGRCEVDSVDVTGQRPHRMAARGVARTFQIPQVVGELTVRENLEMGMLGSERHQLIGALLRLPSFRARERRRANRARQVAAWLGLPAQVVESRAEVIPLGLKRIVELGRAVAGGSHLICLDEPAAGLNEAELARLGVALRQLTDSGHSVLLIEHNLPFVLGIADELALLMNGAVACRWEPKGRDPMPPELAEYLRNVPRLEVEGTAV
jgi:branched-chain amino acid transport system permease protein